MTGTRPIVAAHRGASRLAPENTISAFRLAMSKGAVALELDVHLTSDDQLVVMHDAYADRTTNGSGPVRRTSADEVAKLDAGSWYAPEFAGERVPTLAEILELTEGRARLNIELKSVSAARVAARVIEEVHRHDAADRVIVMSFDLGSVLAAKHQLSTGIVVLPIVGQPIADPLGFVQSTKMDGLNYPPQLWSSELIGQFRDHNLAVHGGLINDAQTMRKFFGDGGQFADSDDPGLFDHERVAE